MLAVALVGLSAWSLHYFKRYQPLADLMVAPSPLDQVGLQVSDAVVTGRVGGKRRWRVAAKLITFSRDQHQVAVNGIQHGTLFDPQERPLVALTAGSAVYQSFAPVFGAGAQGFLQVTGGLQARLLRAHGPTVATASLAWDPSRSLVSSPGPVTAHFPPHAGAVSNVQLQADSAQWDARADVLRSPGHVHIAFAGGAEEASGEDVTVDIHTGNISLQRPHGTIRPSGEVEHTMGTQSSRPALALAGLILASTSLAAAAPEHIVNWAAGGSTWLNAPHVLQVFHGVTIQQDDSHLVTDAAIINLDDDQQALNADSRAPVHLWDTQDDLTGQHGYVDFTKHVATVQDKITLVVKPGPNNQNAPKGALRGRFKDPATLTCEKMIYDYRRKSGLIPGPLTVRQKDRVLTADSGTYDGRAQIVVLTGHVHGHDHDNLIDAPQAYFGVREGDEFIRINAHVHGTFRPKPDDQNNADDQAPVDDQAAYDAMKSGGPGVPPAQPPSPSANPGGPAPAPSTPAPDTPVAPPANAPPPTPPTSGTGGAAPQ